MSTTQPGNITPAVCASGSDSGHRGALDELVRYRHLLFSLTWRDLRIRYKQSVLGVAWAILLPLSMMLVFTFVFTRAIDAGALVAVDMPYALYVYVGLVPWTFFANSLAGCMTSLVANRNLVTKVYFPREVFPLSCVASSLVDFCIALTLLGALMLYFHVRGEWTFVVRESILLVPIVLLVQVALTIGIGMMLAMGHLFYRDVRPIFSVGIQLLMFVSAVVVPVPTDDSALARLIALNPLASIMEAYRSCMIKGVWPEAGGLLYATAVATVALVGGWLAFRRASFRFAECI